MKIFVCGSPRYNRAVYGSVRRMIVEAGHIPLMPPIDNPGWELIDELDRMRISLRALLEADAMIQLSNWDHNRRCRIEMSIAGILHLRILKQSEVKKQ